MNKFLSSVVGTCIIILIGIFVFTNRSLPSSLGSTPIGGEYQSTTTAGSVGQNVAPAVFTAVSGNGTLGSIIIESTGAGFLTLYDATTSDTSKRTIQATSSLRILAAFNASPTVGVYTFDSNFFTGLLVSTVGAQGTTTITTRSAN